MYSLIVPVYLNEDSIPELLSEIAKLDRELDGRLEAVFVVDGSPDRSAALLRELLPQQDFAARLVLLSRNFGSFAAIRAGLAEAEGPYFAAMAADLQDPPDLILRFFRTLETEPVDVTIGTRESRSDPLLKRLTSQLFWFFYRKFVQSEMPPGGADVFGCNRAFRDRLLSLRESNSTLVGLIFWLGFRRKLIPYVRRPRPHGESAWSFSRRLRYLTDSIYAFSDLPVRLLVSVGVAGLALSTLFGLMVLISRLTGRIQVPGYSATILAVVFIAALNSFGLGVIGSYVWRAFENTKDRPQSLVLEVQRFEKERSS
jgi:glycosyltransferase involved in cell wall biosynthesis